MPIEVQVDERLAAVAVATLRVADARGVAGITIRAVAEELGGSATLVTNYLPSRAALLTNAINYILTRWRENEESVLDGVPAARQLATLASWEAKAMCENEVLSRLLLEMLTTPRAPAHLSDTVNEYAQEHRTHLREAAQASGAPDPELAGDVLQLVLRGYNVASRQDDHYWTPERLAALVDRVVPLLLSDDAAPPPPARPRARRKPAAKKR